MRVEGVTQVLEIVDRKSEPHEVEPPVALKRELASPFVCKLPDEGLLVRNLGGSEPGKTSACTCPVQVWKRLCNPVLLSESLGVHKEDVRVSEHREVVTDRFLVDFIVFVHPLVHRI